ncbi:hypothetical protein [Streptomyces sp. NPDC058595]|uniref:hypothetical protein n=1 Tax=Streptomyces sp. NPDC058595 TaxID=3346550 RepID=UPI00364B3B41
MQGSSDPTTRLVHAPQISLSVRPRPLRLPLRRASRGRLLPCPPGIERDETINEPGDVVGDLRSTARSVGQVATIEVFDTASIVPCDATPRPRLVAWVTGDWR